MGIVHERFDRDGELVSGRPRRSWRLKIYTVEGPLSFVMADITERAKVWPQQKLDALVLRLDRVGVIDVSGLLILGDLMTFMDTLGIPVVLCGANAEVNYRLVAAGLHCFHDKVSYCDDISILL